MERTWKQRRRHHMGLCQSNVYRLNMKVWHVLDTGTTTGVRAKAAGWRRRWRGTEKIRAMSSPLTKAFTTTTTPLPASLILATTSVPSSTTNDPPATTAEPSCFPTSPIYVTPLHPHRDHSRAVPHSIARIRASQGSEITYWQSIFTVTNPSLDTLHTDFEHVVLLHEDTHTPKLDCVFQILSYVGHGVMLSKVVFLDRSFVFCLAAWTLEVLDFLHLPLLPFSACRLFF